MLEVVEESGIDVHWDDAVETVESDEDSVSVETEEGNVWEAEYDVGADGAGSMVRKEIDANFEGTQSENSFLIADIEEDPDHPRTRERVFHYDHPKAGGRNVLLVPFQGGWRVDIQCKEDDDAEQLTSDTIISDLVAQTLGERYRDRVIWVSEYKFKQVIADRMTDAHHPASDYWPVLTLKDYPVSQ